jgi:hypothetical protein
MMNHSSRPIAATARVRIADRLFLGGCTVAYLTLMAIVVAALKLYGG